MGRKILKKILAAFQRKYDPDYCWNIREKALSSKGIVRALSCHHYTRLIRRNGAGIPLNASFLSRPVFPHGLQGVFVSSGAQIGRNCVIFHQVTIGSNTLSDSKKPGAPVIGDDVYIGAGAKIIGGVRIGHHVRIGANCVVTHDVPDHCTVVLPAPKVIPHKEEKDNRFVGWEEFQGREQASRTLK